MSVGTPTWIPHGSDSIHSIAIAMTQDEVLVTNKRRFSGFDQVCQLPVALSLTQFSKASSELTIGFQPPVGSVSPFPIAQKAFPNYPFVDGDLISILVTLSLTREAPKVAAAAQCELPLLADRCGGCRPWALHLLTMYHPDRRSYPAAAADASTSAAGTARDTPRSLKLHEVEVKDRNIEVLTEQGGG